LFPQSLENIRRKVDKCIHVIVVGNCWTVQSYNCEKKKLVCVVYCIYLCACFNKFLLPTFSVHLAMPANYFPHHHDGVSAQEVYRHIVATNHHVVYDIKVCVILFMGGAAIIACIVYILLQCRHKRHNSLLKFCKNDDCKGLIKDFDNRDSTDNLLQTGTAIIKDCDHRNSEKLLQSNTRTVKCSNDTPPILVPSSSTENLQIKAFGKCSNEFYV
jgi:hypothetical protein